MNSHLVPAAGVINDVIPNSTTNHQAIIEFKGKWYFFYHNAGLHGGGEHQRSVCVERFYYDPDGTIRSIIKAKQGLKVKPQASKS